MFIISVAIGVGQGLQPVASFNYGARKYRRVRQAAIFTIEAAFCMLVVLVGLCWVNGDVLIRLFRDDPAVTAVALPAFHYQCLAMLLQPIIVVANMTFQSRGARPAGATFLWPAAVRASASSRSSSSCPAPTGCSAWRSATHRGCAHLPGVPALPDCISAAAGPDG